MGFDNFDRIISRDRDFEYDVGDTTERFTQYMTSLDDNVIDDAYDSDDDPNSIVGRRIKVRWKKTGGGFKWYEGEISSYDPEKAEHHVSYDDGDQKDYDMLTKLWRYVRDEEKGEGPDSQG